MEGSTARRLLRFCEGHPKIEKNMKQIEKPLMHSESMKKDVFFNCGHFFFKDGGLNGSAFTEVL